MSKMTAEEKAKVRRYINDLKSGRSESIESARALLRKYELAYPEEVARMKQFYGIKDSKVSDSYKLYTELKSSGIPKSNWLGYFVQIGIGREKAKQLIESYEQGYKDSKMKNSLMKFIDSCVGNIARKIEDEFDESKHPRDKGGKFTSKGSEGAGDYEYEYDISGSGEGLEEELSKYGVKLGNLKSTPGGSTATLKGNKEDIRKYIASQYGSEEEAKELEGGDLFESNSVKIDPDVEHTIRSEVEYDLNSIWEDSDSVKDYVNNAVAHLENTLEDTASTDHAADVNYGASKEQVEAVFHKLIDELVEENKSRIEEEENDVGYEEQEELDESYAEGKAQLEKDMKGWWTRPEDVADDLKDAGYDEVEIINDENLYVVKGPHAYRVVLDKAGNTYTLRRVESR